MKKSDLKTGMVVTLRNKKKYVVLLDVRTGFTSYGPTDILVHQGNNPDESEVLYLDDYTPTLKMKTGAGYLEPTQRDIMEIGWANHPFDFIKNISSEISSDWSRNEDLVIRLTYEELVDIVGEDFEIIKEN